MRLKLNRTLRAALIAAITAVGTTLPQAFAETNTNHIDTGDSSLISWFSFAENNEVTEGSKKTGWNNLLTYNAEGHYGTTGAGHNMNGTDSNTKGDSFTLSFDINAMEAGTLLHMRTENNTGAWRNMKLTSTAEEKLSLTFLGDNRHTDIDLSSAPDWATVTITETGTNLLVYVNGVQQGSIDMTGATNWIGKGLGFNFGSDFGGSANVQTAALKNILVYSRALTSTEVMALTSEEEFGTYTWVGGDTNEWSSSAPCWTKQGSEAPVAFTNGNDALFNSTGAEHATLGVTGAILAGTVTVDSAAYTFNIGEDSSITAGKLAITGTGAKLTVNGVGRTMTVDELANDGELVIGEGASVKASATSISLNGSKTFNVSGNGTLTIQKLTVSGGEHTLGAGVNMTEIGLNGGTLTFANGTSTVSGKLISESDNSTLVIGTDNSTAVLKVGRLENANINNNSKRSDIIINSGSTLKITGNDTRTDYKQGSLILGEWNVTPTTVDVKGQLLADQVAATAGDSGYVMNINGGTALLMGLQRKGGDRKQEINISNGGKLILGSTGIQGSNTGSNVTLSVNGGTIGVFADSVTIDKNIALSGNVTFDTEMYTVNDIVLTQGGTGGTLTVSGNITGSGAITKAGAGTLVLSGTGNALSHTLNVQGGTLTMTGAFEIGDITGGDIQEYYVDVNGEQATNGFYCQAGTKTVYSAAGGATVNDRAVYTIGGVEVEVTGGVCTIDPTVNYTTLWVRSGSEAFAAYRTKAGEALTKVDLAAGTSVTMDYDVASITLALHGNGTVNATAATTVTALTGTGKLIVTGNKTVSLQSISGYTGEYEVGTGATLQIVNANLPGTLTVAGSGDVRLLTHATGTNVNLTTVSATNLHLYRDDSHNSRFVYKDGSNIAGVSNLYFDGAQLWLDGKDMTGENAFGGNVTFNATTYSESGQPVLNQAAMRINNSAAFNGTVTVQENTKLAFATDGTVLTFGGAVTGNGQLELKSWSSKTGTFRISDDAAGYGGAILSDAPITLDVANGAALTINSGSDIKGAVTLGTGSSLTVTGDGDSSISGIISGNGGIVKDGDGTLTLKGANTYTGATEVKAGKLVVEGSIASQDVILGENASIENKGTGAITLSDVDEQLTQVENIGSGTLELKNERGMLSVVDLTIAAGSTISFHDKADTPAEGTITVTETLTAGGGKLLANLVLEDGAMLDLGGAGENALTLGSNLAFVNGGLVTLDDATLAQLDALVMGSDSNYLVLFKAEEGTTLTYGEDGTANYDGMWFGELFDRPDTLVGDFKVVATGISFGLTKVSEVPEPTTGTLSLLALAALAARRRRK